MTIERYIGFTVDVLTNFQAVSNKPIYFSTVHKFDLFPKS